MALPKEEVVDIWNALEDKTWDGLLNDLRDREYRAQGRSFEDIEMMIDKALEDRDQGVPFPENADELYEDLK